VGLVLLIVMHESGTWRARPGQVLTFGRGAGCTVPLPAADRGVSRSAGSLVFEQGTWWLRNDSSSSVLYVSGDRGFRVDLPPGMRAPVQQWHAKVRLQGLLGCYTLRLRLPDLDDVPEHDPGAGQGEGMVAGPTGEHVVTSTRRRPPLSGSDRLTWRPGSRTT
jgi:predicted component of type VI protein secretion system